MINFNDVMTKIVNEEELSSFGFVSDSICKQILRVVLYNMKSIINDEDTNINNINELYNKLT